MCGADRADNPSLAEALPQPLKEFIAWVGGVFCRQRSRPRRQRVLLA